MSTACAHRSRLAHALRTGQRNIRRAPYATTSTPTFVCDLDEEPVTNYKPGGYHPVRIGDRYSDGRYKILHKVGWGGFSTVWAARDEKTGDNVALKILQAAASGRNRELNTLRYLKANPPQHPGHHHKVTLKDDFQIRGPNGNHDCLVLDLTGPSIQDYINRHIEDGRLPGPLAKSFARQALTALSCLHHQEIGHGDLHLQNLAVGIPSLAHIKESDFYKIVGDPVEEAVSMSDGGKLPANVPPTIVKPAAFKVEDHLDMEDVRLVDFGASFRGTLGPTSLLNPPVIRPPEAFFGDTLDIRVDLWSMGCTLFELIAGQTPFESGNSTPESIAKQMIYTIHDDFPERWQAKRKLLEKNPPASSAPSLQDWLGVVYFESERVAHLSRDDISRAGEVIARLLRFEPAKRASADEILKDEWLNAG